MKDIAYTIGKNTQLIGVYTKSQTANNPLKGKKPPTILLLNSGLVPCMGPFRLYAQLARGFSKIGFNSFRFDFSGIGDSDNPENTRPRGTQCVEDAQKVMDFLETQQQDHHFIAMGICAGAINAHNSMLADKRIVGGVFMDGYIYPTMKYYAYLYAPKFFSFKSWWTLIRLMRSKFYRIVGQGTISEESSPKTQTFGFGQTTQSKKQTETDFQTFINRDLKIYYIFTSSSTCEYQNQLADGFKNVPFGNNIQVKYLENAGHIYPLIEDRENVTSAIVDWLKSTYLNKHST